jgi:hypothetical protein
MACSETLEQPLISNSFRFGQPRMSASIPVSDTSQNSKRPIDSRSLQFFERQMRPSSVTSAHKGSVSAFKWGHFLLIAMRSSSSSLCNPVKLKESNSSGRLSTNLSKEKSLWIVYDLVN